MLWLQVPRMHHARQAFCAVLNEDPSISAIHCFDVWATLDKLIYIVVERILRTAKLDEHTKNLGHFASPQYAHERLMPGTVGLMLGPWQDRFSMFVDMMKYKDHNR